MQIASAGDRAVLVTLPGATAARLRAAADSLPQIVIVGQESLLVICDGPPDREAIARAIANAREESRAPAATHRIEVVFDGPDLDALFALVPREEFFARLPDVRLSVRYLGFRAGFAYCEGWPEAWRLPRRPTSRNHVPAGTFAIAGAMAGFYPVDSPGGWNLLGRTNAVLWDPNREPPNLFAPGDEIEIVSREVAESRGGEMEPPRPRDLATPRPIANVLSPGQLTTIVGPRDCRRALAGVTPGGPFDEQLAATANRAVGNADDAPLLECVLVGPTIQLRDDRRAAFCDLDGVRSATSIGRIRGRGYLAIEGGIDEMRGRYAEAATVVKKGDVLGRAVAGSRGVVTPRPRDSATKVLRILPGPHSAPALPEQWEVTNQINRIGIRMRGATSFTPPADLPSLGVQFGTLQWHPDGSLIAMGPDHPVTGGYLQPATVISEDLWKLAHLMPGDRVTLIAV